MADSTHVFLLGTNIGHIAITNWIRAHEDAAIDRIDKTIHFIEDVPLQACRSPTNDMLSPWYYRTSLIWLANAHNFWASDFAAKRKKKFGRVDRTAGAHISDMLAEQRERVLEVLLEETEEWRAGKEDEDQEDELADEDAMEIEGGDPASSLPAASSLRRLPPVGNFALSPAPRSSPAAGSRTPAAQSPTRAAR